MSDFFCKKSYERLSPPTTNAFLVESTIFFALSDAAHCTPLHLVAHHCKLGEIFLLKTLRHRKIPKVSLTFGIFSSIFVGISVAICRR